MRRHPAASVFHTPGWLRALQQTYGYEPVVYTTSGPGVALADGIPFCRIRSWLTGRRMVSLPFTDHCEPLVSDPESVAAIVAALRAATYQEWDNVELRPMSPGAWTASGAEPRSAYRLHRLDLSPSLENLFRSLHPSTLRRKIRRAERERLVVEEGTSERLVNEFYRLLVMTRRRHGVPPQPSAWFSNLVDCLDDQVRIRVAFSAGRAIGSILTLRHGKTLVYKYGGSDAAAHNLGAMPLLFWRAIQDAKAEGLTTFDLGRSDLGNAGLITFKERWGAVSSPLSYLSVSCRSRPRTRRVWRLPVPRPLLACVPDRAFTAAGAFLYRHIG